MKYFFTLLSFLFSTFLFAQDFSKDWQKVYELEKKGSYKTAYEAVQHLYKKAHRKKNEAEKTKAFIYTLKFKTQLAEVSTQDILNDITVEMNTSKGIYKEINRWYYIKTIANELNSSYNYYLNSHIKNTTEILPDDIEKWSAEHYKQVLNEQIDLLFQNEKLLKETKVHQIKPLIDYDFIDANLNQTVFEFFALNFITEYETAYYNLRFDDVMKISDFSDQFKSAKIIIEPSSDIRELFSKKSIELFQQLEDFYTKTNDDFNLDKVKFLRFTKNAQYIESFDQMNDLGKNLKTEFYKNRFKLEQATFFVRRANKNDHKDYYEKALQLTNEIRKQTTKNDVLDKAVALENTVKQTAFTISLLNEVYENEPVKYLINYKNLPKLHLAYYDIKKFPKQINDSIYKVITTTHQPVATMTIDLPEGVQYFSTSTEILGKQLPLGNYLLVAYQNENDLTIPQNVQYNTFKVSNVMVFNKSISQESLYDKDYGHILFYFVHPKTGKPYPNAAVTINAQRFTTNENGTVLFTKTENTTRVFHVQVFLANETYQTTVYEDWNKQYVSHYTNRSREYVEALFYTDRSIYRPGQEVQFKGILYQTKESGNEVVKNKSVQLIISDDNSDELETRTVTTNDMGSFSGTFRLPKNILTGDFEIDIEELDDYSGTDEESFWDDNNLNSKNLYFKVEEYKRPTFDVQVDEIKKNIYFNEEIELVGRAKSLAGGSVANAQVIVSINAGGYEYRDYFVKKDTIQTDASGAFNYKFVIPSQSKTDTIKKEHIKFSVDYHFEVTDNAGEVRGNRGNFFVANYATRIAVYGKNNLATNEKINLNVTSFTQNGDDVSVNGTVKIFKTLPPNRFYMQRSWQVPEMNSIDEETFRALFPYEAYNEADQKFTNEELVYEGNYTTQKDKKFIHDITNWQTGSYKVVFEIIDEKSKLPLTTSTTIEIINANEKLASNEAFKVTTHQTSSAKELVLQVHTAYEHTTLYLEILDTDAKLKTKVFPIAKGTQILKIPLANSNENTKIAYQWYFAKEHLMFNGEESYLLPQQQKTSENFVAQWEVWNNKLIPGSEYQWKLKLLSEQSKKPLQGEFLASMYDASLDMLHNRNWDTYVELFEKSISVDFGKINTKRLVTNNFYGLQTNFYYTQSFYNNQFNYFGYSFSDWMDTNYLEELPTDYFNEKSSYYQIEVRHAVTQQTISNALIYNIINANEFHTNAEGFGRVWGEKSQPIAITALGFKQARLQLKEHFTVVYLEPTNEPITQAVIDDFSNQIYQLYRLNRIYSHLKVDDSYSKEKEIKFVEEVLKNLPGVYSNNELSINVSLEESIDGDFKDSGSLIGGALKSNKGSGSGERFTVTSKTIEGRPNASFIQTLQGQVPGLNISTGTGQPGATDKVTLRGIGSINDNSNKPLVILDGVPVSTEQLSLMQSDIYDVTVLKDAGATAIYGNRGANGVIIITTKKAQEAAAHLEVPLRKNLSETAFFYPHLKTDKNGSVEITFKAPEALTEWKFRGVAHNNKAETIYTELLTRTQKDVMIQPNMPRFVRETDVVVLKARVSNTTSLPLQATAYLRLFNTITGEDLTDKIIKTDQLVPTTINGLSANTVSWSVEIPKEIEGLQYRISVKAGSFTDGEESVIPVLSNRTLITETAPIWQLGMQNKDYKLYNLLGNDSKTLKNHQFVVEVSHNATWLAMQSLPYLFDYQHNCNEQIFSKYFADVLATKVLNENESMVQLIAEWRKNPKSKLEENEDLKNVLLQETPWMKDLISNEEKKAQWAAYFDSNRLEKEATEIVRILGERQNPSGGFGWFSGGSENDYITQHILVTTAQLDKLGVKHFLATDVKNIVNKAHRFIDVKMQDQLKKQKEFSNQTAIDYAFVKSYYTKDFAIPSDVSKQLDQNLNNLKKNWVHESLQNKAKIALIAHRKGDTNWAKEILNQLNESAVIDETYGMYWKENSSQNYYYYNAAEVQALIIEAFKEIEQNETTIQKLNAWLLSQKLNKDWGTTKATTAAIYALLLSNSSEVAKTDKAIITLGNQTIKTNETAANQSDDLLGYQNYQWKSEEITNDFGAVSIKNKSEKPVFGGIYWQYFEDLSAVKEANNGILKISRKFYIENSDNKLQEISNETKLHLGQKVIIRLEIAAEKDMEFVHIKDVRAATFEPIDVLSGYKYENNLRFYQSTRDAATHFFIDYLRKGKYVVDYEVRLNNEGNFTSGISTIQSMYAPEHTAHTAGQTIKVDEM
ncbi:alpha-2-macroglobulin family protein [Paenimyroides aestuarii]|uniref:MG2 domain-containing protein n=1 Tax=Paenimyroides aestuarii TaxID=2968490 RepID=A0ABY5NPW2_9FLAO|nr:MG2 domain-containing protein [Paenimyroides aestuarii]UUV20537.1 MG2 domain-containing protein [Paenimyroides aestuarii]